MSCSSDPPWRQVLQGDDKRRRLTPTPPSCPPPPGLASAPPPCPPKKAGPKGPPAIKARPKTEKPATPEVTAAAVVGAGEEADGDGYTAKLIRQNAQLRIEVKDARRRASDAEAVAREAQDMSTALEERLRAAEQRAEVAGHHLVSATQAPATLAALEARLRAAEQRAAPGFMRAEDMPTAGWLLKKGGRKTGRYLTRWKKRWFVLHPDTFAYYEKAADAEAEASPDDVSLRDMLSLSGQRLGEVLLNHAAIKDVCPEQCTFVISSPQRDLPICTTEAEHECTITPLDRENFTLWVETITARIAQANGVTTAAIELWVES